MMYGYGGWDTVWWLPMATMMLIGWGGLAAIAVLLIRSTRKAPTSPGPLPHTDAEQILAQRFARGEIDEGEYQARTAALRRQPPKRS